MLVLAAAPVDEIVKIFSKNSLVQLESEGLDTTLGSLMTPFTGLAFVTHIVSQVYLTCIL